MSKKIFNSLQGKIRLTSCQQVFESKTKHLKTAEFLRAWNNFSRSQAPSSLELLSLVLIDFHCFFHSFSLIFNKFQ